jgi:hypothetical protein
MRIHLLPLAAALGLVATPLTSQVPSGQFLNARVRITPIGGYMGFGTYFNGPSAITFSHSDGGVFGVEVTVPIHGLLSLSASWIRARSDWAFETVPLFGKVTLSDAHLWFADLGARLELPISGNRPAGSRVFVQAGAGLARYSVSSPVLSDRATNGAATVGAGLVVPVAGPIGITLMAKDYLLSFRSLRNLQQYGVEGRRAHSFTVLAGLSVGF